MARSLQIISPDPHIHKTAMYDLIGKSFSNYWSSLNKCRSGYIDDSHYDWNASRVGLLDGELVSHFGVWDYQMRVGIDSIRTAGVGAVATNLEHRKRGYMKQTAEACCNGLKESDFGFSVLYGISDFYHRFGYVNAWNGSKITINKRDLPDPEGRVRLRKSDLATEQALDLVSNRTNAGLTGTAVHPTYRKNRYPKKWTRYKWNASASPGYVVVDHSERTCSLVDCGGDPAEIIAACIQLVKRRGCSDLRIADLHRNHPLLEELQRVSYRREESNNPSGGAMIRITNLYYLLNHMRKTLTWRLRESSFSGWNGTIFIQWGREYAVLSFERRGLRVLTDSAAKEKGLNNKVHQIRAGDGLAQLFIGTADPYRIIERHKMHTSGEAKNLVGVLFPEQFPCLGRWDQF